MKRVITYGTFDLLHYGHINLLRRAKALGDYLIVGLSTDQFNWQEKQKKSYFTYEERKAMLEAIRYVDLVIPEENWDQKKTDVERYLCHRRRLERGVRLPPGSVRSCLPLPYPGDLHYQNQNRASHLIGSCRRMAPGSFFRP